jgi:hypothetical protein
MEFSIDQRIARLLHLAEEADRQGRRKQARTFRRMARDLSIPVG